MIEILGSLHSDNLLHNFTIELADGVTSATAKKVTLGMNKLIACMMSGVMLRKCEAYVGNANSNSFNANDVGLSDLVL
jgi:hypothetical protein